MNYSLFLFSKLYDSIIGVNYEYDYMYDDLQTLYKVFEDSGFNNKNRSEYDCIVDFLKDNRLDIQESILKYQK
jgi:hypothetical protein